MKKAFVIPHLGLGDLFTCNGIVRALREKYSKVCIVVLSRNMKNAKDIFSDDEDIEFYEVENDKDISIKYGCNKERYEKIVEGYDVYLLGLHKHGGEICAPNCEIITNELFFDLPFSFYKDVDMPYNYFWDYFYVPMLKQAEQLYSSLYKHKISQYIFMHNTASTGDVFTVESMERKFNFDKQKYLVINPCKTVYKEGDAFYELSKTFVGHPLLHYKKIIMNASKVLVSDSSFMCMSINLEINTHECYIFARAYGHGQKDLSCGATHMGLKNSHIWTSKYIFGGHLKRQKFKEIVMKTYQ